MELKRMPDFIFEDEYIRRFGKVPEEVEHCPSCHEDEAEGYEPLMEFHEPHLKEDEVGFLCCDAARQLGL